MSNEAKEQKKLSVDQRDKLEIELYTIFQEVNVSEILLQLQRLKDIKQELEQLHSVLELSKCCLEKVCKSKSFFCC